MPNYNAKSEISQMDNDVISELMNIARAALDISDQADGIFTRLHIEPESLNMYRDSIPANNAKNEIAQMNIEFVADLIEVLSLVLSDPFNANRVARVLDMDIVKITAYLRLVNLVRRSCGGKARMTSIDDINSLIIGYTIYRPIALNISKQVAEWRKNK